ncbi:MAG: vWA domain-containing protein [Eubacteriales bacterium]
MKKDLTELVFILDRSGSMSGLESDTIGGYNAMLDKQKKQDGEAVVTTVLFDDEYELLHDRIMLKGIRPITEKEYFVRGSTALLDAVGKTIKKIDSAQNNTADEEKAEKVIFVITTDGMENSSKEYTHVLIKRMIERQKSMGWEFIFLGANIDAEKTAADLGINADRAANFHADKKGVSANYMAACKFISNIREDKTADAGWKDELEKDFKKRGKK